MKMAVISDPQVDLYDGKTKEALQVLRKCFANMNVDIVAVCGDISEYANATVMDTFFDTFSKHCSAKELIVVPGNMDGVCDEKTKYAFSEALERYFETKQDNLYFAKETDACFLIGISPEPVAGGIITNAQLDFLDKVLRSACVKGKPALIFSHFHLRSTINNSWKFATLGDDGDEIKSLIEKHNGKVVFFAGHTHRGLIAKPGGSVITIGNATYVSTPSICWPDREHYNADNDSVGTGYVVEITHSGISIKGFDFLENEYLPEFQWIV